MEYKAQLLKEHHHPNISLGRHTDPCWDVCMLVLRTDRERAAYR